jgi:hypothetical protein
VLASLTLVGSGEICEGTVITKNEKCTPLGDPGPPRATARRVVALVRKANSAYGRQDWKNARQSYEAVLTIERSLCKSGEDELCQVIAEYTAS